MYKKLLVVGMALGPIQPPIQWVPGSSISLGLKLPGHGADHSHPTSVEINIAGAISSLPNTSSWRDT
jgi:hypothetical protein